MLIAGTFTVLRYVNYSAPGFDFGIWVQMFHNMKTTLEPVTTVERNMTLSHFAVHFSPILYLLLPIYYVFPSNITLQIAQVVLLMSGIIPLWLLMRKYNLNSTVKLFLAIAYCAYPAISYGCIYDFHENCFILPLLLWMFLFYELNKKIPMFIFAFLVLTVKEEAFASVFLRKHA